MKKNVKCFETAAMGTIFGMIIIVVLLKADSCFIPEYIPEYILYAGFMSLLLIAIMRMADFLESEKKRNTKDSKKDARECLDCRHFGVAPFEYPCNSCDFKMNYKFESIKK